MIFVSLNSLNPLYKPYKMKKIGIIILGVIVLALILALTLVFQVLEFVVGAILFIIAIIFLIYLYFKVKNKLD